MSKLFQLNFLDVLKGFAVAVLMAVLTGFYTAIQNNSFPVTWNDWKIILIAGLGAGLAYLIKNIFTSSNGEILKKE